MVYTTLHNTYTYLHDIFDNNKKKHPLHSTKHCYFTLQKPVRFDNPQ